MHGVKRKGTKIAFISLVLMAIALLCAQMSAQSAIAVVMGHSVDLSALHWKYQQGDEPNWKDPAFIDTSWSALVPEDTSQNRFLCTGFCWYRLRVSVPNQSRSLGLGLNNVDTSYEVFVNGRLIGIHGRMPPNASNLVSNMTLYSIPDAEVAKGQLQVALRVWVSRFVNPDDPRGGVNPDSRILLGETADLELSREQDLANAIYQLVPSFAGNLFAGVIGLAAISLYLSQRNRREYLWGFAIAVINVISALLDFFQKFDFLPIDVGQIIGALLLPCTVVAFIELVFALLNRSVPKSFRMVQWTILLLCVPIWMAISGLLSGDAAVTVFVILRCLGLLMPCVLVWAFWRGNREVGFLAATTFTEWMFALLNTLAAYSFLAPLQTALQKVSGIWVGPMFFGAWEFFYLMSWVATGLILLTRSNWLAHEGARMSAELQAAKAVQDVLMPRRLAVTPGFSVDSVYRPAQEVGGDFFHILPIRDGGLRVVIGDVSGKGLRAAMMVSLIIGGLDRETDCQPARLLQILNRMLVLHSVGGFTTCLCLNITPDGRVTAANAGHLDPYLNGREIPMTGDVPLGIIPEVLYQQMTWTISSGDRLLLFSDGLPEARDADGALYGFERTGALIATGLPADQIADAAQAFGQDDDITLVEVSMLTSAAGKQSMPGGTDLPSYP